MNDVRTIDDMVTGEIGYTYITAWMRDLRGQDFIDTDIAFHISNRRYGANVLIERTGKGFGEYKLKNLRNELILKRKSPQVGENGQVDPSIVGRGFKGSKRDYMAVLDQYFGNEPGFLEWHDYREGNVAIIDEMNQNEMIHERETPMYSFDRKLRIGTKKAKYPYTHVLRRELLLSLRTGEFGDAKVYGQLLSNEVYGSEQLKKWQKALLEKIIDHGLEMLGD